MDAEKETEKPKAPCSQKALKISAKARYALRILLDVAAHEADAEPRSMAEISAAQRISLKFISRLVIPLRAAGMLHSTRGTGGGFRLGKSPEDIRLLEIIETMQGPVAILDCLEPGATCPRIGVCIARRVWADVNAAIAGTLAGVTLQSILDRSAGAAGALDYCI